MSLHISAEKRCVQLLRQLVGFKTHNPGGDEVAICHFLADQLRERGADEVEVVEVPRTRDGISQVGAYVFARFGTPRTLLNAHIDTVPPNTGWTTDPFTAMVDDQRVVGLGTADTKGAVAAILTALEGTDPRDVGVLFSGDEERGSSVMPVFLASKAAQGIQRAVVCEPTGRVAGIRHRGVMAFNAHFEGKGGHSSGADSMPKPIAALARLAVALDDIARAAVGEGPADMKGLCLNLAKLDGGVALNVVPDRATLCYSLRPYPGFDIDALTARVAELASKIDPAIEIGGMISHAAFAAGDTKSLRPLLGDAPQAYGPLQFWTEASLLQEAGINAVVIGPGDITHAHAAGEWVSRADLRWAIDLFHHILGVSAQLGTD